MKPLQKLQQMQRQRWLSGQVSASELEGFQVRTSIPLKFLRVLGLFHVKSYVGVKRPPAGADAGVWRGGASSGVVLVKITRSAPNYPSCCFRTGR
ncbi:hypothetical protein AVEN_195119-1 [Araneus ventricosus]|uniref:Uncharacterized protein n=1 Tax=Araneus ventricosus TaxID=182803 RepID=A0A4Y2BI36_ARAVE|nr:hypothetical protein AVEN_195119-1 [Araneus ventricosus]